MAYIAHSPVRDARGFRGVAHASLFARCALVAVAAAVAILALADGALPTAPQAAAAAAKGDRISAPQATTVVAGGYVHDPATRTTTVERGAAVPLGAKSPMLAGAK